MQEPEFAQLERQISIGMIVDTEYLKQASEIVDTKWVQSKEAKLIMSWCLEFYEQFQRAPQADMPDLYMNKIKETNIQKSTASIIEDILEDLSDEYEREDFNSDYLLSKTKEYTKACKLKEHAEHVLQSVENGNVLEAEADACNYKPPETPESHAVKPLSDPDQIKKAFQEFQNPLLALPNKRDGLGNMVNHNLTPQGFVILMAQNKGGKSYHLLKWALLAAEQGKNVVFFQGGDMSQAQQERRMAMSFARRSDLQKYCGPLYIPQLDCWHNQNGDCNYSWREGGKRARYPYKNKEERKIIFAEKSFHDLLEVVREFPEHKPCYACRRSRPNQFTPSFWYKKREAVKPLTWKNVHHLINKRYKHIINKIRIITYPSDTLTMSKVDMELDILEKQGFVPDVCAIDYLDICAPDYKDRTLQPRDQENKKWQQARRISQERNFLLLSASQSDADGFSANFLRRKNFSEDRRKLDHVTAMYGINMTDEEKKKGIMRFNDIVGRETQGGDWVYVLHRLETGQPILNSFS